MADEFKHDSVGGELSRAEWEAIGTHVFDSQATGDLLIASSATQLSRLPIGIANQVPHVAGGTLVYASILAGLTLTSPNINGVIGTTGLTIPAFTLGGAVTGGGQTATNLGGIDIGTLGGGILACSAETTNRLLLVASGVSIQTTDGGAAAQNRMIVDDGAASIIMHFRPDGTNDRLQIADTVVTIGTPLTFNASVDSALVVDEVSLGGFDIAPNQRSLAISQENPVVVEAIGASDRTLPVRINGTDYKIMLHT